MSGRIDPFAGLKDAPVFEVKQKIIKAVEEEAIEAISREHRFPSRQPKREPAVPAANRAFIARAAV
jgi:hypothetical protein